MTRTVWAYLDLWARRMIPFFLALFLVLVMVLPLPIPGHSAITPMLALAAVFFWAIHHPRLLPAWAVFVLGVIQDILTGALLGTGTVVLLLAYGAVLTQRRFFHNKSFLVVWWGFAMVTMAATILSWAIASVFAGQLIGAEAAVFQMASTIAIYPVLTWIFHLAQRLLPAEA